MNTLIIVLLIVIICYLLWLWQKKKKDKSEDIIFGYDQIILRFEKDVLSIISQCDEEIDKAKKKLETSNDKIKRMFLQSFIDCVKNNKLHWLCFAYEYNNADTNEYLDPLFEKVARSVVMNQKYNYSYLGADYTSERFTRIKNQLKDCGIITEEIGSFNIRVLVSDIKHLNKILKKANGKTLLTAENKVQINEYINSRKKDLIEVNRLESCLPLQSSKLVDTYKSFMNSYNLLLQCNSIWEVVSEEANTAPKSYANTIIDRKKNYSTISSKYFCYVRSIEAERAAYFNFEAAGVKLYIYPEFVVVAKANDFNIVPINNFDIFYRKKNFVETSSVLAPKDAKFVKNTYKHINKNGERDARYSDNPMYSVFEYGDLIFKPLGLIMQFSNSQAAEKFAQSFYALKLENKNTPSKNESIYYIIQNLYEFIQEVANDDNFLQVVNNEPRIEYLDKLQSSDNNLQIHNYVLSDAINSLKMMGNSLDKSLPEIIGVLILGAKMMKKDVFLNANNIDAFLKESADTVISYLKMIENCGTPSLQSPNDFILANLLEKYDSNIKKKYINCMYEFSLALANTDGELNDREVSWLEKFISKEVSSENDDEHKDLTDNLNWRTLVNVDPLFEESAKIIVEYQHGSTSVIQRKMSIGYNRAGRIMDQLEQAGIVGPATGSKPREVLITSESSLNELLLRIRNNEIRENSDNFGNSFKQENTTIIETKAKEKKVNRKAQKELESLIGLECVKAEVKKLTNFIKIQQVREQKGLKTAPISYHCVFTGNPGTGKTTVARIVAEIYKELGILKKGHLIETDRSGLVAEYVGQTAVKTNNIIDSALDGVLFIDEAYSLIQSSQQDFGKEAISTLLKRMEDDRDRLVVILAGYGKEIKDFIDSNPGLSSRFNRYINFEDYNANQLLEIFKLRVKEQDYLISNDAEDKLKKILADAIANKDANFGNGRFVRNIFEKALENQATRLASEDELDTDKLKMIEAEDI